MNNLEKGNMGESYVCEYLTSNNYKILKRNYRAKKGEIDIIAKEAETIIFVEVKTRTNNLYGSGAEAVTERKQKLLQTTAQYYIMEEELNGFNFRFDVAEVVIKNSKLELNYMKSAF